MLQVTNLSFGFGEKPLYKGVNFIVGKGQKVGLVGPNGSGKSTLLSIITGGEDSYTGVIKSLGEVALVPQEIKYDSVMDKANTIREYVDPKNNLRDFEIQKMFKGLELDLDLTASPKKLSGGQKTKLALARALFLEPEVLLLDEPTNFMDKAGKRWVMKFLSEYKGSLIVISHDLELMDKAIDKILAISPHSASIEEYKGTYSDYERLKKQKEENLKKEFAIKARHLKRMEEGYTKLGQFDSKRTIWRHRIERERAALPAVPPEIRKIKIKLPEPKKVGEMLVKVSGISKNYGSLEVLKSVDLTVLRGDKIALIGPNGSGKSTFIKILTDMITPDRGEVYRNSDLLIGYYSQEFETFDFNKSVISTFCDKTQKDGDFARSFLGRYLFSNEKVFQRVGSLSGGEKTRLSIAILTGADNNLLVLDEPTTYLDVLSQRIILESLKEYKGTMIFVSHTPEFVKELNPNKAFIFPAQKMFLWDEGILNRVGEI